MSEGGLSKYGYDMLCEAHSKKTPNSDPPPPPLKAERSRGSDI